MYTDNEIIKAFKRFLKESGEYTNLMKKTNIIWKFDRIMRSDEADISKEHLVTYWNVNEKSFDFDLAEFHEHMYQRNNGQLLKDIKVMFERFIKEYNCENIVLELANKHLQDALNNRPFTTWSKIDKHHLPYLRMDTIGQLVENKRRLSPYAILNFLYNAPIITGTHSLLIAQLHYQWFNLLRSIARQ